MSERNPFTKADDEERNDHDGGQQWEAPQREPHPAESGEGFEHDRGEDVSELKDEIRDLREEVEKLHGEEEDEPPEPDFECTGDGCDGFAVEEAEAEHVTTKKSLLGENTRPVEVECPRCGEEMEVQQFVPKEEQVSSAGDTPLIANQSAAGRAVRERFQEEDREEVLEEAKNAW
jgi:hypothetical protein